MRHGERDHPQQHKEGDAGSKALVGQRALRDFVGILPVRLIHTLPSQPCVANEGIDVYESVGGKTTLSSGQLEAR